MARPSDGLELASVPSTVIAAPLLPWPLIRTLPPPTSTPEESRRTLVTLRRDRGSSWTCCEPRVSLCSADTVFTSGATDSTVTSSDIVPTSRTWVWRTLWDAASARPVRTYVLKPSFSILSV